MPSGLAAFARRRIAARSEEILAPVEPFIRQLATADTLLDYGCGIGHLGRTVADRCGARLTSLDIKTYPLTDPAVEVELYPGDRIPYADNHFQATLAAFALHHTTSANDALAEIARVTAGTVLVLEDRLSSRAAVPWEAAKDVVANGFLDRITFQYHTPTEWEALFAGHGLTILVRTEFSSGRLLRFKHIAWLLEPTTIT